LKRELPVDSKMAGWLWGKDMVPGSVSAMGCCWMEGMAVLLEIMDKVKRVASEDWGLRVDTENLGSCNRLVLILRWWGGF
jgi:hypothetical protein